LSQSQALSVIFLRNRFSSVGYLEISSQLPGSRVLDGRPGIDPHAMALPKGRDPAVAYARKFIGENPDVIVTITTPTSQAAIAATKDIPIIFTTVTDPLKSKLVTQEKHPGGNASGISDLVPAERQLDVVKEIVPNLKSLGLVYDPGLDNARSTVESIKAIAPKMGFTIVESPAMGINNVPSAGQALVGKVDAIFVPNDTTVYGAFESLVKVAQDGKVPLFTAERRSVQRGAVDKRPARQACWDISTRR
jgi:putative ABC transport system substrate-binding protein